MVFNQNLNQNNHRNLFMKLIRDKKTTGQETNLAEIQPTKQPQALPEAAKRVSSTGRPLPKVRSATWKILIVDDEPEVHAVTKLSVSDLIFDGKKVQFFSAMSGPEAREILAKEPDIAVALVDVVMETEDAGLRLVNHIRKELGNRRIRLIIRTGQPGSAPERYVIDHYDIDDYKDKTELTAQRLYTTLRTTLKAYRDLTAIEHNREGLEKILTAVPNLYRIQPLEQFFEGVLTQITSFCPIGENNLLIATIDRPSAKTDDVKATLRVGMGKFFARPSENLLTDAVLYPCKILLDGDDPQTSLPANSLLLPMKLYDRLFGCIYLEDVGILSEEDKYLLQILATQCAAALNNLELYTHLEEANRQNARKNLFLGMAAHDLRNPLGVIKTSNEMLHESALNILTPEQLEYLFWMKKSSEFALTLVNNLLDVAKIESGKLELETEPRDFIPIVSQGVLLNRSLAEAKRIQLEFNCQATIPKMMVDAPKIQQVMNNLISNAIKYSHPYTKVEIRVHQQESEVVIAVKDEGQGIPPAELNKLFQPFSKTSVKGTQNEAGTGLGLLICRQIVEAHHGRIWVASEVGKGSTFYVALPLSDGTSQLA
jgi:signal transduction histidine kinase